MSFFLEIDKRQAKQGEAEGGLSSNKHHNLCRRGCNRKNHIGSQQMQECGVEVMHGAAVFERGEAEFIGAAMLHASLDAASPARIQVNARRTKIIASLGETSG